MTDEEYIRAAIELAEGEDMSTKEKIYGVLGGLAIATVAIFLAWHIEFIVAIALVS